MSWRSAVVSPDGTHHRSGGEPLYGERFDEVLKFHAPGLAPVRRGGEAWHVRPDGAAAYARRFQRTFGFYEGRAAVVSPAGWHHVHADGRDAYPERYAWCGNFQEGCATVREEDGLYHHVDPDGRCVSPARWRYAGDFRDGVAVVQGEEGRSTHVDAGGGLLHGRWFLDLDVFHKGSARARDEAGWMHVDREGRALYPSRFAAVEPFYNGQARVEGPDGALLVIDERGTCVLELRPPLRSAFQALSADLVGFWRTQALAAAVRCGVFEALPGSSAEVARACGLTADGARRLLEALAEAGAVEGAGAEWRPSARGVHLRRSHPLTLADAALEYAGPLAERWADLPLRLRGGEPGREDVFREVARDPARREGHHRMLASYARHDYPALVPHLPIRDGDVVLDAGGGTGVLAACIAARFPRARVVLGDLPDVAAAPQGAEVQALAFDLRQPWPLHADVVVLARVLHDWPDPEARRILRRAVDALRAGGRLALVEFLRPDDGCSGALCDLHLLGVSGGRERRLREWVGLLQGAGLRVCRIVPGAGVASLLVAEQGGGAA